MHPLNLFRHKPADNFVKLVLQPRSTAAFAAILVILLTSLSMLALRQSLFSRVPVSLPETPDSWLRAPIDNVGKKLGLGDPLLAQTHNHAMNLPEDPEYTVAMLPMFARGHNHNQWHELTPELGHHHGQNPYDYIGLFGAPLQNYLNTYGSISYPWQTPNENQYKHTGYVWLYDEAVGGCEQFMLEGSADCVTHVLVQVHSIGTAHAAYTRYHSQYAFVRVCSLDGAQCGVVATGGWVDYGILHAPYKNYHCVLPNDPLGFGGLSNHLHQPPYRSNPVDYVSGQNISQFWNSLGPNPITQQLFPEKPNWILGLVWMAADAWAALDPQTCDDYTTSTIICPDGSCEYNHSRFYIFSVRLHNLPEAPFSGWTNRWGHVVDSCSGAGLDCVPLLVTEGVPSSAALLNRQVSQRDPDQYARAQEFDVMDASGKTKGWLNYPGPLDH